MLSVLTIKVIIQIKGQEETQCGDLYIYGYIHLHAYDGFMGVYLALNSSSCTNEICTALETIKEKKALRNHSFKIH